MDQVAEFRRTRRVREGIGTLPSVSAGFGPAGPIYLGNAGLLKSIMFLVIVHLGIEFLDGRPHNFEGSSLDSCVYFPEILGSSETPARKFLILSGTDDQLVWIDDSGNVIN